MNEEYFEEKTKALDIEYATNIDNITYLDNQIVEIKKKLTSKIEISEEKMEKQIKSKKPKLAIIIDDMTTKYQIDTAKKLNYIVNISFLPPTTNHRNSAFITNNLNKYIIHLPLQANNYKYEEENTLHINDNLKKIERRIVNLKSLYPKAKFINNHTGSRFTSNKKAMNRLLKILKKYNYTFIDSRTTAKSVVIESAKKYGIRVLSRNIFLDNKKDKYYIRQQLRKAVKIAKKSGSAIAIGHPYSITFDTLRGAKDILKGVELVYVDEL